MILKDLLRAVAVSVRRSVCWCGR